MEEKTTLTSGMERNTCLHSFLLFLNIAIFFPHPHLGVFRLVWMSTAKWGKPVLLLSNAKRLMAVALYLIHIVAFGFRFNTQEEKEYLYFQFPFRQVLLCSMIITWGKKARMDPRDSFSAKLRFPLLKLDKPGILVEDIRIFFSFHCIPNHFPQSAVVLEHQYLAKVYLLQVHSIMTIKGTKLATGQIVTIESIWKDKTNRY